MSAGDEFQGFKAGRT